MSVAQSILDIVRQYVPEDDAPTVTGVRVRVGRLSGVVAESLDFCFSALVGGTPFGNARLDIDHVGAECECEDCGARFEPVSMNFLCPACAGGRTRLISGSDLQVVQVELA